MANAWYAHPGGAQRRTVIDTEVVWDQIHSALETRFTLEDGSQLVRRESMMGGEGLVAWQSLGPPS